MQLYAAGEASLTELLDACRVAEEAQLMRLDLVQDIALTRLAVMRAAGSQLDATLDRECRDGKG
jgi:outer membrane protein TolC